LAIQRRGFGFLIPIGKSLTQQEEKNDVRLVSFYLSLLTYVTQAEEESEDSQSARSGAPASVVGENESMPDLDASVEDFDRGGDDDDTDDDEDEEEDEEDEEDYEEDVSPSSI